MSSQMPSSKIQPRPQKPAISHELDPSVTEPYRKIDFLLATCEGHLPRCRIFGFLCMILHEEAKLFQVIPRIKVGR